MSDNFYHAFEDRYRGSRELIRRRLECYLPFVAPLREHYPDACALDLGCGRGEWLELLTAKGIGARGVDLDDGMLSAARVLGLDVRHDDALNALQSSASGSLMVVSAFHLVEHISFDQLRELVRQALRVLVPGGVLIMETPNPENLIVAGCNFYLDPTHQRPIPPIQLEFVCEYEGFARTRIVRLHEPDSLHDPQQFVDLGAVIEGVSQDYAIVAQKTGNAEIVNTVAPAFEQEYGLTLRNLADRSTRQTLDRFQQGEQRLQQVESRLQQMEVREQQALEQLTVVYASTSWRLTAPLRRIGRWRTGLWQHACRLMLRYAEQHPQQRRAMAKVLNGFPGLKSRLVVGILGIQSVNQMDMQRSGAEPPTHLAPHVRWIHQALQSARQRHTE